MKRRTLIGLTAALITGIGAECKAGEEDPYVDPDAPPEPWAAQDDFNDKIKVVTISAWVEPEYGPYYVDMSAVDHDTGERTKPNRQVGDDPRGDRVEGGQQFRFTLAYPTRHRVELSITVTATKAGSQRGYIATRDGRRLHRSASFGGTSKSSLTITTQR